MQREILWARIPLGILDTPQPAKLVKTLGIWISSEFPFSKYVQNVYKEVFFLKILDKELKFYISPSRDQGQI